MKTNIPGARLPHNKSRSGRRSRNWIALAVLCGCALLLTSTDSQAWGWKKKPKQAPKKAMNLDKAPSLDFKRGTLNRDHRGQWRIGTMVLHFTEKSSLRDQRSRGNKAKPAEGREIIVMGYQRGGVFVVRRGTLLEPYTAASSEAAIPGDDAR